MVGFGIATFIFGPLPMISSYIRFQEPWPKISALLGAVVALTLLQIPVHVVLCLFVFGLYVADRMVYGVSLTSLLAGSLVVAALLGFAGLFVSSQLQGVPIGTQWVGWVDRTMEQVKDLQLNVEWLGHSTPESLRAELLYRGPFLFLSAMWVSMWVSVGFAAHLKWLDPTHPYSAAMLRAVRFPKALSFVFFALYAGRFWLQGMTALLVSGVGSIVSILMFMAGTIALSDLFERRGIAMQTRTLLYALAVGLGFPAVVGLGAVSPWLMRSRAPLDGGN